MFNFCHVGSNGILDSRSRDYVKAINEVINVVKNGSPICVTRVPLGLCCHQAHSDASLFISMNVDDDGKKRFVIEEYKGSNYSCYNILDVSSSKSLMTENEFINRKQAFDDLHNILSSFYSDKYKKMRDSSCFKKNPDIDAIFWGVFTYDNIHYLMSNDNGCITTSNVWHSSIDRFSSVDDSTIKITMYCANDNGVTLFPKCFVQKKMSRIVFFDDDYSELCALPLNDGVFDELYNMRNVYLKPGYIFEPKYFGESQQPIIVENSSRGIRVHCADIDIHIFVYFNNNDSIEIGLGDSYLDKVDYKPYAGPDNATYYDRVKNVLSFIDGSQHRVERPLRDSEYQEAKATINNLLQLADANGAYANTLDRLGSKISKFFSGRR